MGCTYLRRRLGLYRDALVLLHGGAGDLQPPLIHEGGLRPPLLAEVGINPGHLHPLQKQGGTQPPLKERGLYSPRQCGRGGKDILFSGILTISGFLVCPRTALIH